MPATYTVKPVTAAWTSASERQRAQAVAIFDVFASEAVTPYQAERAGSPIPAIGGTVAGLTGLYCQRRRCEAKDETRRFYRVTCDLDDSLVVYEPNPLSEPTAFEYDEESAEEAYFVDETTPTAKQAMTTAGEPFAELPTREAGPLVITATKNVADTTTYTAYTDYLRPTVNADDTMFDGVTWAAGTLLIGRPKLSAVQNRNGYTYRTLTTRLRYRPDGWDAKFQSRGLYELAAGQLKRIAGPDGQPVESPWPLDAAGAKLASASATGATITLKPYGPASLTPLI